MFAVIDEPFSEQDWARAERVLWRTERLSGDEALAIAAAYPPPPLDPPEFQAAEAVSRGIVRSLFPEINWGALEERIDDIVPFVCHTPVGMMDFIRNFDPEAPVIRAVHLAWIVSLLGPRLPAADRELLIGPWLAVPPDPQPGWFGPRTDSVEEFLARQPPIAAGLVPQLARHWDGRESVALHAVLSAAPEARERSYGLVGHLASEALMRRLAIRVNDFGAVPLDDPRRRASYVIGLAAIAECVRDAVPEAIVSRLERGWLAVLATS